MASEALNILIIYSKDPNFKSLRIYLPIHLSYLGYEFVYLSLSVYHVSPPPIVNLSLSVFAGDQCLSTPPVMCSLNEHEPRCPHCTYPEQEWTDSDSNDDSASETWKEEDDESENQSKISKSSTNKAWFYQRLL